MVSLARVGGVLRALLQVPLNPGDVTIQGLSHDVRGEAEAVQRVNVLPHRRPRARKHRPHALDRRPAAVGHGDLHPMPGAVRRRWQHGGVVDADEEHPSSRPGLSQAPVVLLGAADEGGAEVADVREGPPLHQEPDFAELLDAALLVFELQPALAGDGAVLPVHEVCYGHLHAPQEVGLFQGLAAQQAEVRVSNLDVQDLGQPVHDEKVIHIAVVPTRGQCALCGPCAPSRRSYDGSHVRVDLQHAPRAAQAPSLHRSHAEHALGPGVPQGEGVQVRVQGKGQAVGQHHALGDHVAQGARYSAPEEAKVHS
mmetsp:Transcript_41218/g.130968  ORF Transcript_41218/g.130968 Transcript_41218/m.130968 type:complete len:311 (-) Transcript_41218:205-1137(-)